MYKTTVPIKGMHCRSCELLIEDELESVSGVTKVDVSFKKGCAVLHHSKSSVKIFQIESAVDRAGYEVGVAEKKPWISFDPETVVDVFYSLIGIGALVLFVKILELDSIFSAGAGQPSSLLAVLIIGITAGLSTCMALIGGLVLGVSSRFVKENPDASPVERLRPHLFFNGGRIASYAVLGGAMGLLGSMFQLSGLTLGFLTIAVAGVMLLLGLQLTGLFPRLEDFKLALPAGLAKTLGISTKVTGGYSDRGSALMGAATFFLPCGFTQAMQLYAMTTGSFVAGAGIMAMFAIGTAPGLLGVGGLTSVLKGFYAQKFFRFAGTLVVLLGIFNFNNGLNLTGFNPFLSSVTAVSSSQGGPAIEWDGNTQILRMQQNASGYVPNTLKVVKGKPVRWIVTSTDIYTCAASILADRIGVRANLELGENIFEFTATQTGRIPFTCSMGMHRGVIEVVESEADLGSSSLVPQAVAAEQTSLGGGGCGGSGGGGCGGCGGGLAQNFDTVTDPVSAVIESGVQVLRATYSSREDITPNQFEIARGKPVRLEIDVKDNGVGCMSSIMIPGVLRPQLLTAGQPLIIEFTPETPGNVLLTCAMGMARGVIKVN
jgi:uncharacterized protein